MKRILWTMAISACACGGMAARAAETDLDFVINKVTHNYAGYADKTAATNKAALVTLTEELRDEFKAASTLDAKGTILRKWVAFFRDHHLTVSGPPETQTGSGKPEAPPTLTVVDKRTVLVRIPSFDIMFRNALDKLLAEHHNEILAAPRLILDLRGNGGGSDACFQSLMPYIYTGPIVEPGAEIWASKDNAQCLLDAQKEDGIPIDVKQMLGHVADLIAAHDGGFVEYVPETVIQLDTVLANPKRVAILVDRGCGSSTEQFLLYALQSSKAILFGENTLGCIDYANVFSVPTPTKKWVLNYPISRSKRLPDHPVDSHGISPHVRVDSSVENIVKHVIEYLDKQDVEPESGHVRK